MSATAIEPSEKERKLRETLRQMESVVVAFSGGVDSAYLALLAHETLGDRALAVTGESPSYPDHQRQMARLVVSEFGIAHRVVPTDEVENASYAANHPDRCFHCKSELYAKLGELARREGFRFVVDGANADDRADYRPGREAARRMGVRSPLDEAELTKKEIRALSEARGLPTANEPASACLASRIPYHTPITIEKLETVERAEAALRSLGFRHLRVRHHDRLARIELAPEELSRAFAPEMRKAVVTELKKLGYRFVTIDLEGYRTGSLNEVLEWPSRSGSRAPGTPTTERAAASK
jgi:uncharacterized protein